MCVLPRAKATYRQEQESGLALGSGADIGSVIFVGVGAWLVTVLGQFSIIYFKGLGLRIGVRVWVRVRVVVLP